MNEQTRDFIKNWATKKREEGFVPTIDLLLEETELEKDEVYGQDEGEEKL